MGESLTESVDKLAAAENLSVPELTELLRYRNPEISEYLFQNAQEVRRRYFDRRIVLWGRISLSSYCKNDCKYCGIRRSNQFAARYQLSEQEVFSYCKEGYKQGIRHFLIEGGVDPAYSEEDVAHIVSRLRKSFADAEIILSLGERTDHAYRLWLHAGATSYLMPQDTADEAQFRKIHSSNMSLLKRKQHMWSLRDLGYQVGSGFLIGMPYQTIEQVSADLLSMKQYGPQFVTAAPFIPAMHTPFEGERGGNGEMVLYNMAILRLMLPASMIIADLSMEQALSEGRQKALSAGANVVITDLTDESVQEQYQVYKYKPGRRNTDDQPLFAQIKADGYTIE